MAKLPVPSHPDLIVGTETSDDAAVYRLTPDLAVVQTLDFFTPVVDNPRDFGAIAAANALSDIYAMGAKPLFALNIAAFPPKRLPLSVLEEILDGAREVASAAGVVIAGGHTVDDPEPKYGLAVTGIVHPDKVMTNSGALAGQALILTKPLGTGIASTAIKHGAASPETASAAVKTMRQLNDIAAARMAEFGVTACTDVTGFGLLGHLLELTRGSQVDATIHASTIAELPGIRDLIRQGYVPGGTRNNLDYVAKWVDFENIPEATRFVLADAQTSGGLLVAIAKERAAEYISALKNDGIEWAAQIGETTAGQGKIRVLA